MEVAQRIYSSNLNMWVHRAKSQKRKQEKLTNTDSWTIIDSAPLETGFLNAGPVELFLNSNTLDAAHYIIQLAMS